MYRMEHHETSGIQDGSSLVFNRFDFKKPDKNYDFRF
jgi:hypothetical protein